MCQWWARVSGMPLCLQGAGASQSTENWGAGPRGDAVQAQVWEVTGGSRSGPTIANSLILPVRAGPWSVAPPDRSPLATAGGALPSVCALGCGVRPSMAPLVLRGRPRISRSGSTSREPVSSPTGNSGLSSGLFPSAVTPPGFQGGAPGTGPCPPSPGWRYTCHLVAPIGGGAAGPRSAPLGDRCVRCCPTGQTPSLWTAENSAACHGPHACPHLGARGYRRSGASGPGDVQPAAFPEREWGVGSVCSGALGHLCLPLPRESIAF